MMTLWHIIFFFLSLFAILGMRVNAVLTEDFKLLTYQGERGIIVTTDNVY